jgi:hypothetical protein
MADARNIPLPLLSKSAFTQAFQCPTKLHYRLRRYPSRANDNPYLDFLADGGFMVEALARALFPEGREISAAPGESAVQATVRELTATDVDLFEPVFEHDGCSARVDILSKRGRVVRLVEIKAASFDSDEDADPFRGKRGGIDSRWRPYLLDLAFQTMVLRGALGDSVEIRPELCLVDKARVASKELVFRKIELRSDEEAGFDKTRASFLGDAEAVRRDGFMAFVPADDEVDDLMPEVEAAARILRGSIAAGSVRLDGALGRHCRECEYRGAASTQEPDGFRECWGALADGEPHILDLYRVDLFDGRDETGIAALRDQGISRLVDIPEELIESDTPTADRQRRQIACTRNNTDWMDPQLRAELQAVPYPLHFVDFETSRIAVPYHAGMRPYEQIAFQFSCHTIERPGAELRHREWINLVDRYPNFEFARALREAIGEEGSMLVWSDHEKSALADIRRQIDRYGESTQDGLGAWLERLAKEHHEGGRIVDLHDLCRAYYLHPSMKGRTSIKYVLPAVWESDAEVRGHRWFAEYLRIEGGRILSPYESLPSVATDAGEIVAVKDGTGAMRMYQDMLYGTRSADEASREACKRLLLQYCRLDTAAMVIVWMHWMGREGGRPAPRTS